MPGSLITIILMTLFYIHGHQLTVSIGRNLNLTGSNSTAGIPPANQTQAPTTCPTSYYLNASTNSCQHIPAPPKAVHNNGPRETFQSLIVVVVIALILLAIYVLRKHGYL